MNSYNVDFETNKLKLNLKAYSEEFDYFDDKTCFSLFGIECDKGWYGLINTIIEKIIDYNSSHIQKIEITQIKEKYGGLRFYITFGTDEIYDLIDECEDESYNICEICGSKENVFQTDGWIKTICKKCYENEIRS